MPGRDLRAGRRAKIICTLGPATDKDGLLDSLLAKGMDAARLNLSFGHVDEHIDRIQRLRSMTTKRRPVAVIVDLPGRKLRVGRLEGGGMLVEAGQTLSLVPDEGQVGNDATIPVARALFHDNMARGDRIQLADGLVELVVRSFDSRAVQTEALSGGTVGERTGVHYAGLPLQGPPITAADEPFLKMAVDQNVDYLAISSVSDAQDVLYVKERLIEMGASIPVIAKIERSDAFARLDGILNRADAVMIRRGDLGAEIEVTRVPLVQKKIMRLANQQGVPVIIATQMLGSMTAAPTPTRAEASDVANAIMDGADGVLLSAETAVGQYPEAAVGMMASIISETEHDRDDGPHPHAPLADYPSPFADVTASIACDAAARTGARLIACFTASGNTAKLVAKYRPNTPVIAFCSDESTRRRLAVHWGLRSDRLEPPSNVETMVQRVQERLIECDLVRKGDRVVIVFGAPVGEKGHTNSVRLHEV
ncbi:MAG: pyruvate kinase [Myxococcota bacterium]